MPSNTQRIAWAKEAVRWFAGCTGQLSDLQESSYDPAAWEEIMTDLLCNLQHLCTDQGLDWRRLLLRADIHYESEVAKGGETP